MKNYLELYISSDATTKEQWQSLYNIFTQQLGTLSKFQIIVTIEDNVVRYFVGADKEIAELSNNIDLGVLRPVDINEINIPETNKKENFVQFVTDGNLLDLKEKLAVKRGRSLEKIIFNIRCVSATKSIINASLYFKVGSQYTISKKLLLFFPAHLLAIDFATNTKYLRKSYPKYLNLEKTLNLFESSDANALFSISTFPYFNSPRYLPLANYEFDKHSFIIGATGSGKSKLIQLLIEKLYGTQNRINYRVIVIDPHDNLRHDLADIQDSYTVNFANETAELFGGEEVQTDISAATELTTSLMKSLLSDQFNARLERVLRFSLFVLFAGQTMSLDFLKRFLTETELRNQVLNHVGGHIPANIQHFFATDFNEMRTKHYNEAILPIVALVDEMQLQPALVGESEQSLGRLIQNNFLTVFSLNKVSMGEKVVKTVAGLLIQQIFLLAQARAFNEHTILIVDEVSVVQNPALASILAEARKFNLSVILTQQYFGQVEKDLRDAIFANVYNYYTFRVSEEDAQALSGNLNMEIPKEIVESEAAKGVKEEQLKIKFLTELSPRECLLRLSANGQVLPCFKAKTMDVISRSSNTETSRSTNTQKINAPKLTKFVESEVTDIKSFSTQGHSSLAPKDEISLPGNDTSYLKPTSMQADINLEMLSPASSTDDKNSGASGVEKEPGETLTFSPSPEVDPLLRKQARDSLQKITERLGSASVSDQVSTSHIQAGMSLSELLATQSSNRKD